MDTHGEGTTTIKMKVTVCFGTVRVIVPVSEGMLVRDLIAQATIRYKKATNKNSWVQVHTLKSQSDGIFDPDDKIVDVADDREKIMAIYEEDNDGMPSLQHNAGDGTSASSVGTNSPDIFVHGSDHKFQPFARTDIEITGEELSSGPNSGSPSGGSLALQVRRGSEPALNRLDPIHLTPPDPSKRWSAAPVFDDEDGDDLSHNRNLDLASTQNTDNIVTTKTNSSSKGGGTGTKAVLTDDNGSTSVIRTINNKSSHTISVVTNNSVISSASSTSNSNTNSTSTSVHNYNVYPANNINSSSTATTLNQSNFTPSASQVKTNVNSQQQQTQQNGNIINSSVNKNSVNVSSLPRSASAGNASIPSLTNNNNITTNGGNNHLFHSHGTSKSNSHLTNSQSSAPSRFHRDQHRLSMQIMNDGGARWADAADRALWLSLRKDPLGANSSPETPTDSIPSPSAFSTPSYRQQQQQNIGEESFPVFRRDHSLQNHTTTTVNHLNGVVESSEDVLNGETTNKSKENKNQNPPYSSNSAKINYNGNFVNSTNNKSYSNSNIKTMGEEVEIVLYHEHGPLGIHVVPEHLENAKNQGLIVQGVESGGRVDRDGRILAGDKIIEINGDSLLGVPFQEAQELFRQGLSNKELKLKVIKMSELRNHPQYSHKYGLRENQQNLTSAMSSGTESSHQTATESTSGNVHNLVQKFSGSEHTVEEKENMVHSHEKIVGDSKVATVSPTKKLQPVPLTRPSSATTTLINSNTRKIGRKYEIDLKKGSQGLGFSITARDTPVGGVSPIYIKNILPVGAAIEQGQLRPGDRLLEVNGIEITGKTQEEAVAILRQVPLGSIAKITVSRQERVDLSPKLPRQIPPEKLADELQTIEWGEREILNLEIPVLDTEKAGLGISVKGRTTAAQGGKMVDMGIYIKSIINGGAASKFGGLRNNDQLLSINGISLLDRPNQHAMDTLRRTMTMDNAPRPKPGFITLTIARRVPSSSAPTTDISGSASGSCDEADSWGGGMFANNSVPVDGNRPSTEKQVQNMHTILDSTPSENTAIFLPAYSHNPNPIQNQYHQQHHHNHHHHSQQQQQQQQHNQGIRSRQRMEGVSTSNVVNKESEENYRQQQRMNKQSSLSPAMDISKMAMELPRNPVLDRLTGKSNSAAVRSESYYKATNETWNATLIHSMMSGSNSPRDGGMKSDQMHRTQSSEVQNLKGEMVMFDDDYSPPLKPPRRSRSSTPDDSLDLRSSSNRKPSIPDVSMASPNPSEHQPQTPGGLSDITYASQTSLEDAGGFARDAFGRQSMSEKRHATLDAKNTDTYQRNKKLREERERVRKLAQEEHFNNHEKRLAQEDPHYNDKRLEALARERNLQDELARRGTKRPFMDSSHQGVHYAGGGVNDVYGNYRPLPSSHLSLVSPGQEQQQQQPTTRTPRRGIIERISNWGQRVRKRIFCGLMCLNSMEDSSSPSSTHRSDGGSGLGLQRVNSADSLADHSKPHQHQLQQAPKQAQMGLNLKEQCDGSIAGSKRDIGPSLGMKKSSSLESLQTMVQEIQTQEDIKDGRARAGPAVVRVVRGRGCNESFRQAVDRSYECPIGEIGNQMETLAEEETESCISGTTYGQSQRGVPYSEPSESDMDGIYGKTKGGKKKQGFIRGLGSMFRFGRHRKSTGSSGLSASEVKRQQMEIERQEEIEEGREKARQAAHSEKMRIEEQYRRLVEKQKMESQQSNNNNNSNNPNNNYGITVSIASTNNSHYSGGQSQSYNGRGGTIKNANNPLNTPNGIRPNHQFRKSMENQAIRDRERERERERSADVNGNHPNHLRSASYDVYNEMTRPGSRMGIAGDPKKYSHYINYEEIKHHLNDEKPNGNLTEEQLRTMRQTVQSQRQKAILESRRSNQHYHSQRNARDSQNPRSRAERPVSNFYEYESVQAAMHNGPQSSTNQSNYQHQHSQIVPQQPQLVRKQQSVYGYTTNNGVTLPSPSTLPLAASVHQRSTSQFQTHPFPNPLIIRTQQPQQARYSVANGNATLQHQSSQSSFTQQIQQQKPNSLPRRSQKDLLIQQQQQQSYQQQLARQQQQSQHQQQQQISGHYISQNPIISPQGQGFRQIIQQTTQQVNQNSNARMHSIPSNSQHTHNHSSSNGIFRNHQSSTSLGSKV